MLPLQFAACPGQLELVIAGDRLQQLLGGIDWFCHVICDMSGV
jgi:hypothetical protein